MTDRRNLLLSVMLSPTFSQCDAQPNHFSVSSSAQRSLVSSSAQAEDPRLCYKSPVRDGTRRCTSRLRRDGLIRSAG